ncbi:PDDEXK nuclease domain-containing protein [Collinsella sp. UBA1693]|uniref:PDDEXK nuclease domain-containing protein n=1 Tax=Collinsella sp. UBA1693 TaxID=1946385 RepID=UPI002579F9A0|nr:PDDEXK nuclease domain-containing protein [Collinsella sp. UBA1693]
MKHPTSPSPLEVTASVAAGKQQAGDTAPNDESVYSNVHDVLAQARSSVTRAVNGAMVNAYWEIGRQINEAIGERAEYGKHLFSYLSKRLTDDFGKGFTQRNLRAMRQFYLTFPIRHTLRAELSWSHYRMLMRVDNERRRLWHMNEAADAGWSSRQLDRQIQTLYYDRLLATRGERNKEEVAAEIQSTHPVTAADSIVRDPYVLEFLNIPQSPKQLESTLEQALIDKLQDFLMELGRGFAFVGRQGQPLCLSIPDLPANRGGAGACPAARARCGGIC